MIAQALIQFLVMIQALFSDYVSRAELIGRQAVELEQDKRLHAELTSIVSSLVNGPATKLSAETASALRRALAIAAKLSGRLTVVGQALVTDYLYETARRPEYAAFAGSTLFSSAGALKKAAAEQFEWCENRFHRPLASFVLHRAYRHVGPADVDVQLVELMSAVHTTSQAAEHALRQLDLVHHVATLLLTQRTPSAALSPSSSYPDTAPTIIQMAASHAVMARLRRNLMRQANYLTERAKETADALKEASHPGGGIEASVVRQKSAGLLQVCAISMAHIEREREYIAGLGAGTVDAA